MYGPACGRQGCATLFLETLRPYRRHRLAAARRATGRLARSIKPDPLTLLDDRFCFKKVQLCQDHFEKIRGSWREFRSHAALCKGLYPTMNVSNF